MSKISTYPKDTNVTGQDLLVGSDWNTPGKITKNFSTNALASYFNKSAIIDTGQFSWEFIPYNNTQAQPEKTFMKVDWLNDTININNLSGVLRVSALTLGNTQPGAFIANEWVGNNILVHIPNAPSAYSLYTVDALVPDGDWYYLMTLSFVGGESFIIQKNEPVVMGYFAGANVVTEVTGTFPILVTEGAAPNISIDPLTKAQWDLAYNDKINSASVTGTTTKTLTLTQQDGGTIQASWTDIDTNIITSVFGRTGAIIAESGDYTTTLVTEGTNLYFTDQRARNVISSSITGITYNNTNGILSLTSGYIVPTTTEETNWNTAYNNSIVSAAVTGVATKTLTLTQQDGGILTASWTDENTDAVTSVFGRTGAVVAQSGDYNTDQVSEGAVNLYFTDARSRSAISLTTTGTSGASTYNPATGVLNIPTYAAGVTSFNTRTGAVTLLNTDVTGALGFTPEDVANKSNNTSLGTSDVLYPTQNAVKTYVDSATAGGIILQGDWNAATNTPDITGTTHTGYAWRVSVAGSTNLGGITDWTVGDLAVKSATGWIKIDNTESVTSVFGRFGTVVAQSGDYNTDQVTEGSTNLYFTQARAIASPITGYNPVAGTITATDSILTAINKLAGGYVPYTGATTNVNLGEFGVSGGYVQLDTTPSSPASAVGKIVWDTTYGTPSVGLVGGNVNLQIGQEEVIYVHNNTGSALTDGQVVLVTGSTGSLPSVALASAASETLSAATLGVVTEPIAHGANGFVTVSGIVNGLDTLAFTEGDLLWLGTTPGTFTTTKPTSPNHLVLIGYVIKRAGGNGSILVKIQNTQELSESSDVLISAPEIDGQGLFLQTIAGTQLWRNRSIVDVLGYTPANQATTITINGTTQDLSANRTWSVGTVTSVGLILGTSGTDANISNSPITSSGSITLNLPTASASNRGLLSNGDWSTFNNKQNTITLTTIGSSGASTLVGTTLNIPDYGSALSGYLPLSGGTLTGGLVINPANTATVGLDVASDTIRFRSDTTEPFSRQLTTTLGSGTLIKMQAAGYSGTYVTDLGFYTSSNSAVNSTPNLYLTGGDNRVGINTTAPTSALNVVGTFAVDNTVSSGGLFAYRNVTADNWSDGLRIYKRGASGNANASIVNGAEIGYHSFYGWDGSAYGRGSYVITQATEAWSTSAHGTSYSIFTTQNGTTSTVNRLFISNNGNVGINNTSPSTTLDVTGTGKFSGQLTLGSTITNGTYTYTLPGATGTLALTSALGNYLPLGGGTLTGALLGTSAGFTGYVGVGNTSPLYPLDITGATRVSGQLILGSTITNGTYTYTLPGATGTLALTSQLFSYLPLSGGTLTGALSGTSADFTQSANSYALKLLNSGGYPSIIDLSVTTATSTARNWAIFTNGSNWGDLEFKVSSANAGNPYTTGSVALRLASTGAATFSSSVTAEGNIAIKSGNSAAFYRPDNAIYTALYDAGSGAANGFVLNNTNGEGFHFKNATTTIMRMNSTGNVGIGTTSPQGGAGATDRTLSVNSGAGAASFVTGLVGDVKYSTLFTSSSQFTIETNASIPITFNTNATERMRITSGGDVLVGTTTNPYTSSGRGNVTIGGSSSALLGLVINNTAYGYMYHNGTTMVIQNEKIGSSIQVTASSIGVYLPSGGTAWLSTSDERMKTDLIPIENATEKVAKLRSVIGRYKTDNKRRPFLIAQDVLSVLPEAVDLNENTGMYGVSYSEVVPLLVASIKEQQAQINELKQLLINK